MSASEAWIPRRCDTCDRMMTRAESQAGSTCDRCRRSGLDVGVAMMRAQAAQARSQGYRDAETRYGERGD